MEEFLSLKQYQSIGSFLSHDYGAYNHYFVFCDYNCGGIYFAIDLVKNSLSYE